MTIGTGCEQRKQGSGDVVLRTDRDDCGDVSWDLSAGFFWDCRMRLEFVIEIFIEVIVDLHTVARNNSESSLLYSAQFPTIVTFFARL